MPSHLSSLCTKFGRGLVLILALWMAGCVMWEPSRIAPNTSGLMFWQVILIFWAVCNGVIFGTGFLPRHRRWAWFFHPVPAIIILVCGVVYFYCH